MARGLRPWLDIWELPPGRVFQEEIERVLPGIKSVAVILGPSGLGPWEEIEIRVAISQFVRRRLPVIPVILPGVSDTPELPLFLQEFNWLRFVQDVAEAADVMDDLVWGITGRHPKRDVFRGRAS